MNDEHRRIIIKRISSYEQQGEDAQGRSPVKPINRWVALIIMIPVLALLAVLGVFFFTIFVALFSIIAVVIAIRIWWLRRKFNQAGQGVEAEQYDPQSDQYRQPDNVEDAEIIEETTIIKESRKGSDGHKKESRD